MQQQFPPNQSVPNKDDKYLSEKYAYSKVLVLGYYKLYWKFNIELQMMYFAVRVYTKGWVGLGLSPNGQMPNSDVIIGWVDDSGLAHMHVSFKKFTEQYDSYF